MASTALASFSLAGKVAMVTGASSGLGAHMARTLAAAGASVGLVARRADRLQKLSASLQSEGRRAHAVAVDLQRVEQFGDVVRQIEDELGPVDVLVNNAGMSIDAKALDATPEAFDTIFSTNTKAPYFLSQAVARRMVATNRSGSIINVASLASLRVVGGISLYAMSKAAVDHMTRALAREWAGKAIRVNALLPGYIETELNEAFFATEAGRAFIRTLPNRRLARKEDLDGPLLLLASDAGRGMSGASVLVDDAQIHGRF